MLLKGRQVLVTGADGFIGSHLVEQLVQEGCKVRALAYYNSFSNWGWLDHLPKTIASEVEVVAGDVRDPSGMRELVKGCEVIFHLAALIGIPFSYHSPDMYVDTNVKGTLNILQAARSLGCHRVLVTSTSEVYGTARYVPIDEEHPLQGQSPYSASKIGADQMTESFHRSFGLPTVIVRPFNTYGPRQSGRAIIPTIISQLLAGKTDIALGSLHPTRDLVYVKDTVEGFIRLATVDEAVGHVVNIATEHEISVQALAANLIGLINPQARIVCAEERKRPALSEVERLLGAAGKLKQLTGWRPTTPIAEGLAATIEWFTHFNRLYKPDQYCI